MLSPELLQILVCPKCKGSLDYQTTADSETLVCYTCKLRFGVIDNIPVMRLDKAQPLEEKKD